MTFRTRLITGFLIVVLVPLAVLGLGIRNEMQKLMLAQTERSAQVVAGIITAELAESHAAVGSALRTIAANMSEDPEFRAGVLRGDGVARGYVIDYATSAMRASSLAMLQIRNDSGRILSSGHFPAEFDRVDTGLPLALASLRERKEQTSSVMYALQADGVLIEIERLKAELDELVDLEETRRIIREVGAEYADMQAPTPAALAA